MFFGNEGLLKKVVCEYENVSWMFLSFGVEICIKISWLIFLFYVYLNFDRNDERKKRFESY